MSEFLVIHYKPELNTSSGIDAQNDESPVAPPSSLQYWAMGADQHPSITLGHGSLEELTAIARGKQVTVLIDAHFTTIESVNIPSKSRSKQLLAVPFAMEDALAEDIEDTHFALGKLNANTSSAEDSAQSKLPVIAIKRSLLEHTLNIFKQQDIHVETISADSVALPCTDKTWTVLLDEDSALIKTDHSQAHSCDRENLALILQAMLTERSELEQPLPDSITYYIKEDDEDARTMLEDIDIEINIQSYQNHALEIFVQNLNDIQSLNLLQGEFKPVREGNLWLKPWKSVAAVATFWLVLQLGYDSMLASQLEVKNRELTRQIEAEFKRAIPDAKKMTNMQKRVERRLNDLKSGGAGSNDSGFLQILSQVSPVLAKNEKIIIVAAVYRNNYIDVDLTAKTLQDIESVKNKLTVIPGIKTVLSTTVEKGSVKGRLRLEAKG